MFFIISFYKFELDIAWGLSFGLLLSVLDNLEITDSPLAESLKAEESFLLGLLFVTSLSQFSFVPKSNYYSKLWLSSSALLSFLRYSWSSDFNGDPCSFYC